MIYHLAPPYYYSPLYSPPWCPLTTLNKRVLFNIPYLNNLMGRFEFLSNMKYIYIRYVPVLVFIFFCWPALSKYIYVLLANSICNGARFFLEKWGGELGKKTSSKCHGLSRHLKQTITGIYLSFMMQFERKIMPTKWHWRNPIWCPNILTWIFPMPLGAYFNAETDPLWREYMGRWVPWKKVNLFKLFACTLDKSRPLSCTWQWLFEKKKLDWFPNFTTSHLTSFDLSLMVHKL